MLTNGQALEAVVLVGGIAKSDITGKWACLCHVVGEKRTLSVTVSDAAAGYILANYNFKENTYKVFLKCVVVEGKSTAYVYAKDVEQFLITSPDVKVKIKTNYGGDVSGYAAPTEQTPAAPPAKIRKF